MPKVRLKIDVSGTVGDEAFRTLYHYDEMDSAYFGPQFGTGGLCAHPADAPHSPGEWIGAEIVVATPLLAQYAIRHYLQQKHVLDADVLE
jgi:hypothetical protein